MERDRIGRISETNVITTKYRTLSHNSQQLLIVQSPNSRKFQRVYQLFYGAYPSPNPMACISDSVGKSNVTEVLFVRIRSWNCVMGQLTADYVMVVLEFVNNVDKIHIVWRTVNLI